mmetsp:Transcript_44439/g.53349  ORF Transcript_44439/g.53349 Transcript_44439/m.53349 type:complete len:126 (-) Transcript_44439:354-731(-)
MYHTVKLLLFGIDTNLMTKASSLKEALAASVIAAITFLRVVLCDPNTKFSKENDSIMQRLRSSPLLLLLYKSTPTNPHPHLGISNWVLTLGCRVCQELTAAALIVHACCCLMLRDIIWKCNYGSN